MLKERGVHDFKVPTLKNLKSSMLLGCEAMEVERAEISDGSLSMLQELCFRGERS